MARLRFPSMTSFRLAVSAGVYPRLRDGSSVSGGTTDDGAVWIEAENTKETTTALHRLGVTVHPPDSLPRLEPLVDILELIPLVPTSQATLGEMRLCLPTRTAARVHALLERLQFRAEIVCVQAEIWFTGSTFPSFVREQVAAAGGVVFVNFVPSCWVQYGWEHPLAANFPVVEGEEWLLTPGEPWRRVPASTRPTTSIKPARWHQTRMVTPTGEDLLPVHMPVRFRRLSQPRTATLWHRSGPTHDDFTDCIETIDDRQLASIHTATYSDATTTAEHSWVLIDQQKNGSSLSLPWADGFAEHPEVPGLFLPCGVELVPRLRPRAAVAMFGCGPGWLVVLSANDKGELIRQRLSRTEFRSLASRCHYEVPSKVAAKPLLNGDYAWALPAFRVAHDVVASPPKSQTQLKPVAPKKKRAATATPPWWVTLSLRARNTFQRLQRSPRTHVGSPTKAVEVPLVVPKSDRVRDQLSSHQALLLGHEWNARRIELEQQIILELLHYTQEARYAIWNQLAAVYGSMGQHSESALCRVNALWEAKAPSADVLSAWLKAELRTSRLADRPADWHRQDNPQTARCAAAYLCVQAAAAQLSSEEVQLRKSLLQLVQRWEAELPVRMVWLAFTAAAKLAGGDVLAVAQCRDRLFHRLNDTGMSLDLDAPGFLRYRQGPSGDRFQTARDWLIRVHEPMQRWLTKLQTPGKLQWAGLDPESTATAAYADLIWAWGFSKLGDRTRAKELEQQARNVLLPLRGSGIAPSVHATLVEHFSQRIRASTEASKLTAQPELPAEDADDLARYAVARLATSLGVLQVSPFPSAFGGREVLGFLGNDPLAERLQNFLSPTATQVQIPWEARRLLALDEADPTAATMPRILFALLERASELDAHLIAAVIPQTLRAVQLIPEWVRIGLQEQETLNTTLQYGRRMLVNAAKAAEQFHLASSLRDLAEQLIEVSSQRDELQVKLILSSAGELMRVLCRLGLTTQAGVLATRLYTFGPINAAKIGLTGGLYAAQDDDAAGALLDYARTKLFLRKMTDERERTELALAYVGALETAPAGIALGRLEELFQRLDMISTTGAANRYYTLKPLRLIDAVVRAAISDDYTLGTAARDWLNDDEFTIRRRITDDVSVALSQLDQPKASAQD